jgi:hypothetical protein
MPYQKFRHQDSDVVFLFLELEISSNGVITNYYIDRLYRLEYLMVDYGVIYYQLVCKFEVYLFQIISFTRSIK